MSAQVDHLRKEIHRRLEKIGRRELLSVSRYVRLVEERGPLDLDQLYFWTGRWQRLEKLADHSKERRKVLGDGSAKGLIRSLRS